MGEEMRGRSWLFIFLFALLPLCRAKGASKKALLIGISTYQKYNNRQLDWSNIHGANDVALIGQTLERQGFKVLSLTNAKATAGAIRKALANLALQTHNGDMVYIHFSGHGQPYEDLNGDEADGWDESFVPYDAGKRYIKSVYEGKRHIVDDELSVYINRIRKRAGRTGFVYVVLDACHIGGASRMEDDSVIVRGTDVGFSPNGKVYRPKVDKRTLLKVASGSGLANVCYLEACLPTQNNTEIKMNGKYYGAMSCYINSVLSHHLLSSNVSWVEEVKRLMSKDNRLLFQDMVVERSWK